MAKLSAFCGLIALFALLGVANAHAGHNFYVTGKVYCDNCAAGFPTRISPAISGATVGVECKDRAGKRLFYNEQHTDNDGLFSIAVLGEHEHEACEAFTVSSPTSCNLKTDSSRGPVYLTHNNGINSDERKTGPFAFRPTTNHPACQAVLAEYNIYNDSD